MGLPLAGITVVALEQAVAAPFATSRLADAGARVIRVERPEGDFARGYDRSVRGQSSYFVWLNRGKEVVLANLERAEDRAHLRDLIAGADVFVQNLKPGALARFGLAPQALREAHPRLITCSISGYGEGGPMASRKAYDLLIQAESGLASLTGGPEAPARVGISVVDIATGATAHAAILEALIARSASGRGSEIDISMFDVMADWLSVPLLQTEGGQPPERAGLRHPSIAPYGVFDCAGGAQVLLAVQNDREWRALLQVLFGTDDHARDPRFADNPARVAHRAQTDALIAKALKDLSREAVVAHLLRADVAFAEVNDMAALARHPHLRRIEVETPAGPVQLPAPAPRLRGETRRYGAVPGLPSEG